MSYIESKVLLPDEEILKKVELNSIALVLPWVYGILFCWLLLIPIIKAISKTIEFKSTEYYITDSRVIEKYGMINTHCDEMRLDRIENITINQTFFGKLFNYGNVYIQGANRNHVIFSLVKDPEGVRKCLNGYIQNKADSIE